jgi:hypothetical protein
MILAKLGPQREVALVQIFWLTQIDHKNKCSHLQQFKAHTEEPETKLAFNFL